MRLPEFITKLTPVGETLTAAKQEIALLQAETDRRNAQLTVSTAEEGLSLWEKDYSLSAEGDTAVRRARIHSRLAGSVQLTPAELEALALTVGRADHALTEEDPAAHAVTLYALYDGKRPAEYTVLKETVERLKPAHLQVSVAPSMRKGPIYWELLALSESRLNTAGAAVGDYVLFAGGSIGSESVYNTPCTAIVEPFDVDFTRRIAESLAMARTNMFGVSGEGYALFSGGFTGMLSTSVADAYDAELVKLTVTSLSMGRDNYAVARAGRYGVIAGGSTGIPSAIVDAYDENLTRSVPNSMTTGRQMLSGGTLGSNAVFAGGITSGGVRVRDVDFYDESLTHGRLTNLSVARDRAAGTALGEKVLFGGGRILTGTDPNVEIESAVVDVYREDMTRTTVESLSVARRSAGSGHLGGYAMFAGGHDTNNNYYSATDIYDSDLTRTAGEPLSVGRGCLDRGTAVLGDRIFFAGGALGGDLTSPAVDVYQLNT